MSTEPVVVSPPQQAPNDSLSDDDDDAQNSLPQSRDATRDAQSHCICPCCANFDVAHQPMDLEISKISHGQQKSYSRSIQTWYAKHLWIIVQSTLPDVCCSARSQDLVTFSKRYNLTFVEGGFSNWKKALQRFVTHEKSEIHREAMMKLAARSSTIDVGVQLSAQRDAEMRNHRAMLLKLLECIRYLAIQGLPLRGHHEYSVAFEGNLYQLLLLQA